MVPRACALLVRVASFGLCVPCFAQSVIVVDASNGPGTNFTSLPTAVAAAGEGDVLIVRPGNYAPTTIDGKSLTLVGRPAYSAAFDLTVRDLSGSQFVAVRNCVATRPLLEDCDGPVLLEGDNLVTDLAVNRCKSVVLRSCYVEDVFGTCGAGIYVADSNLFLYSCTVYGDAEEPPFCGGGPGIDMLNGRLFAYGCYIRGGAEPVLPDTVGGVGIIMWGQDPVVELLDTQVLHGQGAPNSISNTSVSGQVIQHPGTARLVSSPGSIEEGQTVSITYKGVAGDRVWLVHSFSPGSGLLVKPLLGYYHGVLPPFISFAGVVPANGTLVQTFTAPTLAPGEDVLSVYVQAVFVPTSGSGQLASPTQVHLFDSRF